MGSIQGITSFRGWSRENGWFTEAPGDLEGAPQCRGMSSGLEKAVTCPEPLGCALFPPPPPPPPARPQRNWAVPGLDAGSATNSQ